MYMAGNSISIFPIMMVGMLIVRPVKALFTMQNSKYLMYIYDCSCRNMLNRVNLTNPFAVNPDRKMKKCCPQLSTYFERHMAFRKADESLVCSDKTLQFLQITKVIREVKIQSPENICKAFLGGGFTFGTLTTHLYLLFKYSHHGSQCT
jgi:hypothetical protein